MKSFEVCGHKPHPQLELLRHSKSTHSWCIYYKVSSPKLLFRLKLAGYSAYSQMTQSRIERAVYLLHSIGTRITQSPPPALPQFSWECLSQGDGRGEKGQKLKDGRKGPEFKFSLWTSLLGPLHSLGNRIIRFNSCRKTKWQTSHIKSCFPQSNRTKTICGDNLTSSLKVETLWEIKESKTWILYLCKLWYVNCTEHQRTRTLLSQWRFTTAKTTEQQLPEGTACKGAH